MKLIVGLGNPGPKYEKTRHNLGFMVLEQFLKDFEPVGKTTWTDEPRFKSDVTEIEWQPKVGSMEKVILAKPKTYMNNSGMAVSLLSLYYKVNSEDLWIVNDEIDLPLGSMKIRLGGAAAGHHGVESIIEHLKTDKFWRFRMGIGVRHESGRGDDGKEHAISKRIMHNAEDYVIGNFSGSDKPKVKALVKHGSQALRMALEDGMERAMNRFNTK